MNVEIHTAGKTTEKIKDTPASVVLVTRSDIEQYGYTTLTDVLENAPGLYNIYSYSGVSGNFGVRGFWNPNSQNGNIAILVNGVSQIYDNDRTHPLDKINVPVEAIDRIEIIRGPMAVLYGNGASFGVINIITNEIGDGKSNNQVSITYGSQNTRKVAFRYAGRTDDLQYVVNAAHYQTDGLDNRFADMMSPANAALLPAFGVTNPDYSTKGLLEQESKYVGISGSYNKLIFDVTYNETEVGLFLLVPPLGDGFNRTSKNTSIMLGYQTAFSKVIDVDFRATYNNTDRDDVAELFVVGVDNTETIDFNSLELEVLSTIIPNERAIILAGVNYRNMSGLSDFIIGPSIGITSELFEKTDRTTWAFFSQLSYQATDQLSLIAGIRYEDLRSYVASGITDAGLPSESTFSNVRGDIQTTSPRLASVYSIDDHNTVKLLYGEANRLGEDFLNPETTRTTELNYIYSRNDFFASVSLFYNQLEDLVIQDLVFQDGSLVSQNINGGEVATNGIELIINGNFTNHFFGELSVTLQDSEDEINSEIEVGYSPKTVAHAKLAYKNKNTTLAAMGRYVGSMETQYDLTRENPDGSFGARVGDKIDGYFVLDLNYRQDNIYNKMYVNFKVSNVLNEEIRYPNNQETNELLDRGTIGSERMFIGTIGMKF